MRPTMLGSWLGKRATSSVIAPIAIAPSQEFEGNDGPWSTFPIELGTPPQTVKLLISTTSSQTWTILSQGCVPSDPANCSTSRGGLFQPNSSSTWKQDQDVAGGLAPLTPGVGQKQNGNASGLYGYDTISLGGSGSNGPTLDQQVIAGIAAKYPYYLGLFGLNPLSISLPQTTFQLPDVLSSLNQSGLIPSLSWAYTAGNQYRPGPAYGSLTLGGYDALRFEPNNISFQLNDTFTAGPTVNIGGIVLTTNGTSTILGTSNESISAVVDSSIPYIVLPLNVCQQFEETFGLTWDTAVQAYLVNDTLHNTLSSQNTSIVLNIGNSSTVPGQGFNISLPYAAFDLMAEAPLVKNTSRYFPLMRAAESSKVTLGRTFLQEAYIIANYEHNNFSVSQCSWENNGKSEITAIKTFYEGIPPPPHHLSGGAIAGIVIGAVVAASLVVALAVLLVKKRRDRSKQPKPDKIEIPELDSAGNDPFKMMRDKETGLPQSPELDSAVHKGHELESGPDSGQGSPTVEEPRYELDTNLRRSQIISPISERSDATRLHERTLSDPSSVGSGRSDTTDMAELGLSDPTSPMRERSDAARKLKRGTSDPISLSGEAQENAATNGPPA